jgi:hypothetical protein
MGWQRLVLAAGVAAACAVFFATKDDVNRYLKMRRM